MRVPTSRAWILSLTLTVTVAGAIHGQPPPSDPEPEAANPPPTRTLADFIDISDATRERLSRQDSGSSARSLPNSPDTLFLGGVTALSRAEVAEISRLPVRTR